MKFVHSKIVVSLAAFSLFFLASCDALETSDEEGSASIADMPDFGDIEVEQVEVEGVGPTRDAAILNGLNLAVRQVTGVPLQGMTINSNGSLSYGQEGPQDFGITNETVLSISQGSVRSFKLLSDEQMDGTTKNVDRGIAASSASWRVVLSVEVNKYKASEKASLPKVVVADPRTNASRYTVGDTTLGASDASAQIKSIVLMMLRSTLNWPRSHRVALIPKSSRNWDRDLLPTFWCCQRSRGCHTSSRHETSAFQGGN
jgi:hypothetical protein